MRIRSARRSRIPSPGREGEFFLEFLESELYGNVFRVILSCITRRGVSGLQSKKQKEADRRDRRR